MSTSSTPALVAARVVQDALLEAMADYWLRRAEHLEAARPRPGDYTGRATTAELTATWDRLTEAARACRNRATDVDTSRSLLVGTDADTGAAGLVTDTQAS